LKLIKTTFFSGVITFIRIASGFVAGKVIAIFTGTAGVALIGAFANFISIILTIANGGINNGVIKYTAEYDGDEESLKSIFSTSLKISLYCSLSIGFLLIVFAPYCSFLVFATFSYSNFVRLLGATITLYSLNSLFISILNGKGQIRSYTIVNTIGSVVGLIFTIVLVYFYKTQGALYALVLAQSIVFFVTVSLILKSKWFMWDYFRQPFNNFYAKKLSSYSLMAIVSAATLPVSQLIIRNILIEKLGIDSAGYWQGMMRISDGYLMVVTTALSTYYLPKLASLNTDLEIRKEILNGYKIILPTVFITCCLIYFLRFFIIKSLYTANFLKMEQLFYWQLIGDFFKIAAWVLAYLMLAKAMTKMFIIVETLFSINYVCLGYVFIYKYHLQGVTIAFALNYLILFIVMVFIFRKIVFNQLPKNQSNDTIN
jgi:O-antigen/teichoic acid export membrane protein